MTVLLIQNSETESFGLYDKYLKEKKILVSKTLKHFEELLKDFPFVRIHKSYLVNLNEIAQYKKGKGGSVVLNNGKELSVSATRKADLLSHFQ